MDILQSADPILYFLGLSSALKLSLYYRWLSKRPEPKEYVGKVDQCYVYPLKSGRGVSSRELVCDFQTGPQGRDQLTDRHWMIMDSKFELMNYKMAPRITTLLPGREGDFFTLVGPGTEILKVDIKDVEKNGKAVTVSLPSYGVTAQGLDCGDAATKWVNDFLETTGYRLVYAPGYLDTKRSVPEGCKKYAAWTKAGKQQDTIAYQSVTPYHLLTSETLADLNERLDEPVGIERFRANIVIKGNRAYTEDTWKELIIGETRFSTVKLTGRCLFTTIDPETGIGGKEPLKTLNSYRTLIPDPGFGPCLGIQMVLEKPGVVRIGDPVYVARGDNTVKP